MIFSDESQLLQNIKSGYLYRVYLLYGEEKYLKDVYKSKLVKLAASENFKEFNYHVFDGNNLDINALIEACESLPFMEKQKCVLVEKFDYESMHVKDKNKFDELLKDPPESTILILIVDEPLLPKKSAKAKKLLELCAKSGAVAQLQKRSAADIIRFIRSKAEHRNCSFSREMCEYLFSRCDNDMLSLSNEIEKITSYAKAITINANTNTDADTENPVITITKKHIDAVTTKAVTASIYTLAKEILAFRFEEAMSITQNLIYLKYDPTLILASLSGAYIDLYIAKIAKNAGKGESEIKASFDYHGKEFLIRSSFRDSSKFKTEVLRKSVLKLAEVEFRMKSSRADNLIILEQCITELFLISTEKL